MRVLLLLFSFYSFGSGEDVFLFDSSTITSDLNWQTFSNVIPRDRLDYSPGWIEESWFGLDQQANYRIYGSCSDSPVENGSNWVFVPPVDVSTLGLRAINIDLMYSIKSCRRHLGVMCRETVNMYMRQYKSPSDAKMFDAQRDFQLGTKWFSDVWSLGRILTMATNHDIETATFSLPMDSKTKYIQLAFDDNGACTSLLVIKVYYSLCSPSTTNFTIFPKTVWNAQKVEENVLVTGRCVQNATPKKGVNPIAFCTKSGYWLPTIVGSCDCDPGYVSRSVIDEISKQEVQKCEACSVGTYKSSPGDGQCFACPPHTEASSSGQAHCSCLPGFFRSSDDPVSSDCTQPPSRPIELFVKFANQTSVELRWDEPSSFGGRKEIWYEWGCGKGECSKVWSYPADRKLVSRVLRINGLKPDTDYTFNVFAKNKVSHLAGEAGIQYRAIDIRTPPINGVAVNNIRVAAETKHGIQLSWNSSTTSHPITRYEVAISAPELKIMETRLTTEPHFWINDLRPKIVYTFKIRAFTVDWGAWSAPFTYQSGKEISVVVGTSGEIDREASDMDSFPLWIILLITIIIIILLACILLICRRHSRNRKQLSDLDVLDTYKQDTMTPDYGSGHRPLKDAFRTVKLNAPLMPAYGTALSQPPPYYGTNTAPKFKPYVDPTAYEDPNQALVEFTFDIDPQHVFITQVIGGGEFGDVCMGGYVKNADIVTSRPGSEPDIETVAIKTLKLGSSPKAKADFLLEASIMGQFSHPNVVRLIGVVTRSEPAMIVTEYMKNGSLDYFMRAKDKRGEELGWVKVVNMLRGIAAGMKYLTDKGYVHRDLAARNVLVDGNINCKIADFGLSREVDDSTEQQYTTNGGKIPVRWTAPEAITHRKFTASSDVWSYGILMWEVCSFGERPYWEWTNQKVISEIMNGFRLPAPMNCPASLHRLMLWCWKLDRHDRPSFAHLLSVLEKYCSNPDYIFVDKGFASPRIAVSADTLSGTLSRPLIDICPPLPLGAQPRLEDFLQSLGLAHNLEKLYGAGIKSVADLSKKHHLDLLAIGMISEEWNRIRDALVKLHPSRPQQHDEGFFV